MRNRGYQLLGMAVWNTLRWTVLKLLLRRKLGDTTVLTRLKFGAGAAVVIAVFAFVLSRKEGEEE
jgi:hypothetical protein